MDSSAENLVSKSANRKVRKLLGRAYLLENRMDEALNVYLSILNDYPGDGETYIILGNLYRIGGCPRTAENLHAQALALSSGGESAEKLLDLLSEQESPDGEVNAWEEPHPLTRAALARLGARLSQGLTAARMGEIREAVDVLGRILAENTSGVANGSAAENLNQLMPALLELNIRQARAAGSFDLAEALQSLQISLTRHVEDQWADDLLNDEHPLGVSSRD